MNVRVDEESLATMKFGVGQAVLRTEDPKLIRGEGQYTDDVNLKGQAYCAMVRSDYAHGVIKSIDTAAARAMPGVLAVYTGEDLMKAGYGPMPHRIALQGRPGTDLIKPARHALPVDKVRFVGDPVACVIAETAAQAQDAAEAVVVDIDALPAVIDMNDAARPGAPQIYDEAPGNVAFDYHFGDSAKVADAFKAAAHVTRLHVVDSRIVINAMEPRAAVAQYDPKSERFTLYAPTQGVMGSRASAAEMMNVSPEKVRFIATNVGGSFGMKGAMFPEYICVMHGARELGRPVKWTDKRSGSFLSDHHGRAQEFDMELALAEDGTFLAVRATGFGDLGGYMTMIGPLFSTLNIAKHVNSCYRTPLIEVNTLCVFTNTVPVTAYRGAGRPRGQLLHGAADRQRRRRDGDRSDQSCGARTISSQSRFPIVRRRAGSTTAAIFPIFLNRRSRSLTGRAIRRARRIPPDAARYAGAGSDSSSKSPRRPRPNSPAFISKRTDR